MLVWIGVPPGYASDRSLTNLIHKTNPKGKLTVCSMKCLSFSLGLLLLWSAITRMSYGLWNKTVPESAGRGPEQYHRAKGSSWNCLTPGVPRGLLLPDWISSCTTVTWRSSLDSSSVLVMLLLASAETSWWGQGCCQDDVAVTEFPRSPCWVFLDCGGRRVRCLAVFVMMLVSLSVMWTLRTLKLLSLPRHHQWSGWWQSHGKLK